MPRSNRVRLSWCELEDRVVPSIADRIRDRIAEEERRAEEQEAARRAIEEAQRAAELAAQIAAEQEALRTPNDRIESNEVILLDDHGYELRRIQAYSADFTGGTWVASGDITGDGAADLLTAPGKGAAAQVRMFNGKTGAEIRSFHAYEPSFTGGAFVVTADLTGDAIAEVITGTDRGGGPVVAIYDGAKLASGLSEDRAQILRFLAIEDPNFRGGVRVGCGDVDGDGTPDLVATAGFGGGPRVATFDGKMLAQAKAIKEFGDYFAFEPALRDGCYPGVGDLNGDGRGELLIGAGPGGAPVVATFDPTRIGVNGPANLSRFVAGDVANRAGVRVSGFEGEDGKSYIIAADGRYGDAVVYDTLGTRMRVYDRDVALGGGLFDDSSPRNFFDPFGETRDAGIASLVGTYRGTTQVPLMLPDSLGGFTTEERTVTVELRIDEVTVTDMAFDPTTYGPVHEFRGRVRVEVPGFTTIDEAVRGSIHFDPFTATTAPTGGNLDFGNDSPFGALASVGGSLLRWEGGVIRGTGVSFSVEPEYYSDSLGVTTFEWTRV